MKNPKAAKRLIPLINSECFFNGRSFKQRAAKQPHCTRKVPLQCITFVLGGRGWIISLHLQMYNCSGLHCVKSGTESMRSNTQRKSSMSGPGLQSNQCKSHWARHW